MTDAIYPQTFSWDGDAMVPLNARLADRQYTVGETYRLAPFEERSYRSHAHYFASVNEVWQNLPDELAARFPTAEHLRKHALIKTGFRNERSVVCDSPEEAQKVAAFIKPMDDYAIVIVQDNIVIQYTAKSQSTRAMNKEEFQKSKEAVLDALAPLISVERKTLEQNAGKAA